MSIIILSGGEVIMKVYTKTKERKNKKSLWALIIGLSLIACAVIITLCVTLTVPPVEEVGGGNVNPPITDQQEKYVMPLDEYTMGQDFSDKLVFNKTLEQWRTHNGVDFLTEKGASVRAIFGGKVIGVEDTTLEGTVITIEQNDGLIAIYKSLASETKVEEGDTVKAGDIIGTVDQTMATEKREGVHLHLEMKKDGELVSPLEYLPEGSDK